jgi:hypothetical protein
MLSVLEEEEGKMPDTDVLFLFHFHVFTYIFQAASLLSVLEEGEGKMRDILDDIDKMVLLYLLALLVQKYKY